MTYCSACGVQNEDGSLFCANCGSKLDSPSQQLGGQKAIDQNPQYQSPPQYTDNQSHNQDSNLYQSNSPNYSSQANYGNQPSAYSAQQYGQPYSQYPIEDRVSFWIYIVSFLFFPAGLILYFSNRQQKPKAAKNIMILTIVGFFFLWVF